MAVSHVKSDTIADFTGTITGFNSQGSTTTIAATDLVRPADWNSAHNQFYTLTGNTTGNSTASGTNVLFAGSGGVSVGGSTGTVVFSCPSPVTINYIPPAFAWGSTLAASMGNASIQVHPIYVPQNVVIDRGVMGLSLSISTSSDSSHGGTLSLGLGLYTQNASTLSLGTSGIGTYAWTNTSNNSTSVLSGIKNATIALAATLTPGNYWLAVWSRTSTVNANWFTGSYLGVSGANAAFSGSFMQAVNATYQMVPGMGEYSATSAALPVSMAFSHLTGTLNFRTRLPLVWLTQGTQ